MVSADQYGRVLNLLDPGEDEMATKITKKRVVWGLYGILAVCIFVSALSVKSARANDTDRCTYAECLAGESAASEDCQDMGGSLIWTTFHCPDSTINSGYTYCCSIGGLEHCTYFGFCD